MWKKGEEFGFFFTDLYKAFDCLDHNLLVNKLSWYGVPHKSLDIIFSYLNNLTQGFSRKSYVKYGVPYDSVLGPLLLNIDLIDLFLECEDDNDSSYADDTYSLFWCTRYISVTSKLQRTVQEIFDWGKNNNMKANPRNKR